MSTGTLRAGHELLTPGLTLASVVGPAARLGAERVTMRPRGEAVEVEVEFSGVSEADGNRLADAFSPKVSALAQHLTLTFADRLSGPVTKTTLGRTFLADSGNVNISLGTGAMAIGSAPPARIATSLTESELNDALLDFERSRTTVNPDLASAREMCWVAMQAEHAVARFLVLYSALAVFAVLEVGSGWQRDIDTVLLRKDPTVPMVPGRGGRDETIYTAARNRLIHAEDRGWDPAAASREVERLTPDFQRLVARILRRG